jgi:hypothetical protein
MHEHVRVCVTFNTKYPNTISKAYDLCIVLWKFQVHGRVDDKTNRFNSFIDICLLICIIIYNVNKYQNASRVHHT